MFSTVEYMYMRHILPLLSCPHHESAAYLTVELLNDFEERSSFIV